VNEVGLLTIL